MELILLGIGVGLLSGFFGIGGGTILIPLLLLLGFETKDAIGISVIQMVFSSIYGSYLNNKKGTLDIDMVSIIGFGGFIGALFSGWITAYFDDKILEVLFLCFAIFAFVRMFFKTQEYMQIKKVSSILLFCIGLFLGIASMTIGVGGSILLVPILVSFLHIPLKKATSSGLFFVVFSSISGFISHSLNGHLDFIVGITIGLASLIGVYIGITLKDKIKADMQKKLLIGFYLLVILYLFQRII